MEEEDIALLLCLAALECLPAVDFSALEYLMVPLLFLLSFC